MNLREYLFHNHLKISEFAKKINYQRTYINMIVKGRKPGMKLAKEIEKATNGQVSIEELLKGKEE